MHKYVIEREIPGAGSMSTEELAKGAQTSNDVLATLTPRVQWQESYVTGDKIFCVYLAEDEQVIAEHAALSGFPATAVHQVVAVTDPTTADARA
jgi:hypothetical protein